MIQRKQTLWLLLSAISGALSFKFPFFTGTVLPGTSGVTGPDLSATDNMFLILLTVVVLALSVVSIFLFKDRKRQAQLTILGLLFTVTLIAVYFLYTKNFAPGGHITITAILTLFILAGFFFATRGIRKDQKLIKDLNRLR